MGSKSDSVIVISLVLLAPATREPSQILVLLPSHCHTPFLYLVPSDLTALPSMPSHVLVLHVFPALATPQNYLAFSNSLRSDRPIGHSYSSRPQFHFHTYSQTYLMDVFPNRLKAQNKAKESCVLLFATVSLASSACHM